MKSASHHIQEFASSRGQYELWKKADPLLTRAQEHDLFTRLRACPDTPDGRHDARELADRIARANIPMVVHAAKPYLRGKRSSADAIISEGLIGLNTAIGKFDPGRGNKFSTMAYPWILQAIRRELRRSRPIVVPNDLTGAERESFLEATATVGRAQGAESDPLDDVHSREPEPIDELIDRESRDPDAPRDRAIQGVLDQMSEMDRAVLIRHAHGKSLGEIGEEFGYTRQGIHRIYERAVANARSIARGESRRWKIGGVTEDESKRRAERREATRPDQQRRARETTMSRWAAEGRMGNGKWPKGVRPGSMAAQSGETDKAMGGGRKIVSESH